MTASEMFGVPVEGMRPEARRRAKAINFGIIYGISAFGLATQLGIAAQEAGEYITHLFRALPGHPRLYGRDKRRRASTAIVETLFGRQMQFPGDQLAATPSERAFLERAAINAPIQGTAADIIRRAMMRMPEALARSRPRPADAAAGA